MRVESHPTPDGDRVFVHHSDVPASKARVFILHGLEGSVDSHYVPRLVELAAARGWSATVLVFRGCGPELNSAPRLYHSGETSDLSLVLGVMAARNPAETLYLVGVSLGGNVLLKYLGEDAQSIASPIRGAATISTPYDLERGCRHLQQGFARVYDRHFLKSLRRKAWLKLAQHPKLFDPGRLQRAKTIEDFDDAVTGPIHGFTGSNDYYTKSSSIRYISGIRVPTLLLSAVDDPFLPREILDKVRDIAATNPMLTVHFPPHGGHVGFIAGRIPFRPVHWGEERVMAFFDGLARGDHGVSA